MRIIIAGLFMLCSTVAVAGGVSLPPYTELTLKNGAKVLLMEQHQVPLVALSAQLRGGPLADPPGKEGTAALLAELLRKGAGARDAAQFAEAVEAAGGALSTDVGRESLQVEASFMARDLDLMLELVSDLLMRPRLDAAELDKLRQRAIDGIRAAKDGDPNALLGTYASRFLFGEHPYGRATSGDETSLAAITHEDVVGYARTQLGADRLILAMAGDFRVKDLQRKLERRFGSWGKATAPLPVVPEPQRVEGRRVLLVDKPGATQTYFWLGNVGTYRLDPQRVAQDLVNSAFGGRFTSMLNTKLRIESGLSYGARSGIARHSRAGAIALRSFTATGTTQQAVDLALATLERLHAEGLSADALASTQRYELGRFPPELETATQLAEALGELGFFGLSREEIDGRAARMQAATLEDARKAIDALYPSRDNLAMVFIGDAAQIRKTVESYGAVTQMSMSEPRFAPGAAIAGRE